MTLDLYVNLRATNLSTALVRSAANLVPVRMTDIVLADTLTLNIFLCDGAGALDAISGDATYSLRVGVGQPGQFPTPALQTTWTPTSTPDGWTGTLSLATAGVAALVGAAPSVATFLEIELTDPAGKRHTIAQAPVTLRNEVVDEDSLTPEILDTAYTTEEADGAFVQNRSAVTSLTGGTAGCLDQIVTLDTLQTGVLAAVTIGGATSFYQLVDGTDAESDPDVIRPDDYDDTNNTKVWKLSALDSAGEVTFGYVDAGDAANASAASAAQAAADAAQATADGKVEKTGDTMTGALVLPGDPASGLEAATKDYVDNTQATNDAAVLANANSYTDTVALTKVTKAGDDGIGVLRVATTTPTFGDELVAKTYVDGAISDAIIAAAPIDGTGTANRLMKWSGTNTATNASATDDGATVTFPNSLNAVRMPDGIVATPGISFAQQTDLGFSRDADGQIAVSCFGAERARFSETGFSVKPTTGAGVKISGGTHAGASENLIDASQTWNNGSATITAVKVNVTDTASAAASKLADFQVGATPKWTLKKDGSVTQTGALTLPGAPTAGNEAATKTYVDTADALLLPLTGGTLSGALTGTTITADKFKTPAATLTYAATTNIDFAAADYQIVALTGAVTFTMSNLAADRVVTLEIQCDGTARAITWPASIRVVGTALPATITASKIAIVTFRSNGTTAGDVRASISIEA